MSITSTTCSSAGAWTFVSFVPGTAIPTGVYLAQYNGSSYLNGSLMMQATIDPATCYWYACNFQDPATKTTFSAIYPSQSLNPLSQTVTSFKYVVDPSNCAASLSLGTTSTDPPLKTNGIIFSVDPNDATKQSLYSANCNAKFVPAADGKSLIATGDSVAANKWKFTAIKFPPPPSTSLLPANNSYFVSWTGGGGTRIFATNNQTSPLGFDSSYDFNKTQAKYQNNGLNWSCGGGSGNLLWDPNSPFYANLGAGGTGTLASVSLTASQIYVDGGSLSGYQLLPYCRKGGTIAAAVVAVLLPPIFSVPNGWQFQVTNVATAGLTSLPKGEYVIQYKNAQCLQKDGSLGVCGTTPQKWTYDPSNHQLSFGTPPTYLVNPNSTQTTCAPFQPFAVTADGTQSSTKRFMLTVDNKFFDMVTGLCYNAEGDTLGGGGGGNQDQKKIVILLSALFGTFTLLGILVILLWKRKK